MLSHLSSAFGIVIGIHDETDNVLAEFPPIPADEERKSFCNYLGCNSSSIRQRCDNCNREAFQMVKQTHKSYIYKCHLGFTEAMVPIFTDDTFLLALMVGQCRNPHVSEDDYQELLRKIIRTDPGLAECIDHQKLRQKYNDMLAMSDERMQSVIYILEIFSTHITNNQWIVYKNISRREQIVRYIKQHYSENITIEDMAEELHLSRSHLSRIFKQILKSSFTECLHNERIEAAKQKLRETDMKITEISFDVGFSTPSYFMKIFKQKTGITPSMYRNHPELQPHDTIV